LAFLVGLAFGWLLRSAWPANHMTQSTDTSNVPAEDCEDASAKAKPLHVVVEVSAKKVWPTDGAKFTYSYLTSPPPTEKYLDDADGNITRPEVPTPPTDPIPVCISFHLKPDPVTLGNTTYALSFATGGNPTEVLDIREETSPGPWPGTFEEPVIALDGQKISVLARNSDKKSNDYALTIKATPPKGHFIILQHDPKIRNGGGQKLEATGSHAGPNLPVARSG
jgi:hypothetical protein